MSMDDPGLWKQISGWLWAVLAVPLAALWRKADNAATKQELKDAILSMDKTNDTLRTSVVRLFENAEADRAKCNDRFTHAQGEIHKIHVEVLNRLGELKAAEWLHDKGRR